MINTSDTSQFNIARQSYMANSNQSVKRPEVNKDDKEERGAASARQPLTSDRQVMSSARQNAVSNGQIEISVKKNVESADSMPKQEVRRPVVVKAEATPIKLEISDAGRRAADAVKSPKNTDVKVAKTTEAPNAAKPIKTPIVNSNDGMVKKADSSKSLRSAENKEAATKPVERRERIMENIDLEVEAQANVKADIKELVSEQNVTSEAHRAEVKGMVEQSMADTKERVADAIETAREASESSTKGPQILNMSGMTTAQMQTLYAQGRISYDDYQDKVDARKEELQERIEANNETQRIVVGLDMISRGFNGTQASDLVAS